MKQDKLILEREKSGLTHGEVARAVGISRSFYTQIELGTRRPSVTVLLRIASFFQTSIEDIFLINNDASSNMDLQNAQRPPLTQTG